MALLEDTLIEALHRVNSSLAARFGRTHKPEDGSAHHHAQALLGLLGCPLCNDRGESERVHFFWLLSETYQQPGILEEISAGLGFCVPHAMYLVSRGESVNSLAYIYRWVIEDVLRQLSEGKGKAGNRGIFETDACYTCRIINEESGNCGSLMRLLATREAWQVCGQPGLLCQEHLSTVTAGLPAFRCGPLLELHRAHLVAAQAALLECLRPHPDSESLTRALHLTVGHEPHLTRENPPELGDQYRLDDVDAISRLRSNLRCGRECPICVEKRRARKEWFRWLNARAVGDADLKDLLPSCAAHVWEFVRASSPEAARLVSLHLCAQAAERLQKVMSVLSARPISGRTRRRRLATLLPRGLHERLFPRPLADLRFDPCPVCYRAAVAEDRCLLLLLTLLGERRVESSYEVGAGLCVKHLAAALRLRAPGRSLHILVASEQTKLSRLAWEIDEHQRKVAYQWRPETPGPETSARRRAALKVSGSSDLAISPLAPELL
jgi:hypothetical protein